MYCYGLFCQICVSESKNLVFLDKRSELDLNISYFQMLKAVFPELLSVDNSIERVICCNCRKELTEAYKFKEKCLKIFKNYKNYGRSLNQKTDYICKDNLNIFRNTRKRKLDLGYNEITSRDILFQIKKLRYGSEDSSSNRDSICSEISEENLKYNLSNSSVTEDYGTSTIYLSGIIEEEKISTEVKQKKDILDPEIYLEIEQFCIKIENRQTENDSCENEDISECSSEVQDLEQDSTTFEDSPQMLKGSNSEESRSSNQEESLTQFSSTIEDNQQILKRSNSEASLVLLSSAAEGSQNFLGRPNQAESLTQFSSKVEDSQQILKRSNSEESLVLLSSTTEGSLSLLGSPNQAKNLVNFSSKVEDNQQISKGSNSEESLVLLSSTAECSLSLLGNLNQAENLVHFSSKVEDNHQILKGSNSEESLVLLSSTTEGSLNLLGSSNQAENLTHFSSKVEDSQQVLKRSNSEESLVLLSSTTEGSLNLLGSSNQAENLTHFSSKLEDSQQVLKHSNSEKSLVLLSSTNEGSLNLLGSSNQAENLTHFSSKSEDNQQISKGLNSEESLLLLSTTPESSLNLLGSSNQIENLTHFSSKVEDSQQISKGLNSIESFVKFFSPTDDHNQILQSSNPIGSLVHFEDSQDMLECSNQAETLIQSSPTIKESLEENSLHITIQDTKILECSNSVKTLVQLSSTILDSQNILECQDKNLVHLSSIDESVEMMDCSDQIIADNKNILVCLNELEDLVQDSPRVEDSNNVLGCPNQVDNSEHLQLKIEDGLTKDTHENIDNIKNILETSEERLQKYIQSNSYEFFLNETTLSTVISECPNYEQALKECSEENCDESSMSSSQIFNRFCKKEENISRPSTRVSNLSDMYDSPNTSEYISDSEIDMSFPDWVDTEISSEATDKKPILIDPVSESTWSPQNVSLRENQTTKIDPTSDTSGTQQAPSVILPSSESQNIPDGPRENQTAKIGTSGTQKAPRVKLPSVEPLSRSIEIPKNVPELPRDTQTAIIDNSGTQQASSMKIPSPEPVLESTRSLQNAPEPLRQNIPAIIGTNSTQQVPSIKLPSLEPLFDSSRGPQNVRELSCEPETVKIDDSGIQQASSMKLPTPEHFPESTSPKNVLEPLRENQTAIIDFSGTQQAPSIKLSLLEPISDSTRDPQNIPKPPRDLILDTSGPQQASSVILPPQEPVTPKSTSTETTSPEVTLKRDSSPKVFSNRGTSPKEKLSEISTEKTDIKPILIDLASESTGSPQNVLEPLHESQTTIIDLTSDTSGIQQVSSLKLVSLKSASTKITSQEDASRRDTSSKDTSKDTSRVTSPKNTSRDISPKDNSKKDTSARRSSSRDTSGETSSRDTSSTRGSKHYPDTQVCHICNKILNTQHGLQLHIYDKHTRKRHQCSSCPETFKRYKSYKNHFRRMHDRMAQEFETTELRNELDSLTAADRAEQTQEQMFRSSGNYSHGRMNNPFLLGPSVLNVDRFRTAGYVPRCRNCGAIFSNHIDFKSHIFECNKRFNEFLNFV